MVSLKHLIPQKNKKALPDSLLDLEGLPGIDIPSADEAHAFFDSQAREALGISGEEFLRRWDAGEFQPVSDETPEDRKIGHLAMLVPFARVTPN